MASVQWMCINHLRSYWLKAMFKKHYKKVVIVLLLIIVIYVLNKFVYHNEEKPPNLTSEVLNNQHKQLLSTSKEHSSKQQLNTAPADIQASDEKQPKSLDLIQDLIELAFYQNKEFKNHVTNLPLSSQFEYLVKKMGISNLTTIQAQKGFIYCTGKFLLQMLKDKQPNSPMAKHIPPSFQHCKNMSFKSSGPLVALASFPSSGNSWVRQLLEAATGIYTGAANGYCDLYYVKAGMIGENVGTNNVLVVKAHGSPTQINDIAKNPQKVIYLVRNPFEVILAEKHRNTAMNSKEYTGRNNHKEEVDFKYSMYVINL